MCSECWKAIQEHPEFLVEYDRLRGTTFSKAGLVREIDVTTGKAADDLVELNDFIEQYIHRQVFSSGG